MRDTRIKDYLFLEASGNATTVTQYTDHVINGEILRINAFANFTGSVILRDSGTSLTFVNYSVASGTNTWAHNSFLNTTGSFVVNNILSLAVGSLVSGTALKFGPIQVMYR